MFVSFNTTAEWHFLRHPTQQYADLRATIYAHPAYKNPSFTPQQVSRVWLSALVYALYATSCLQKSEARSTIFIRSSSWPTGRPLINSIDIIAHFVLQQSSPKRHIVSFMLVVMRLYGHLVNKMSVVNRRCCALNFTHSAYVFVRFRLHTCIFVARFAYKWWLQVSHFLPQQPQAKRRSTKTLKIIPA